MNRSVADSSRSAKPPLSNPETPEALFRPQAVEEVAKRRQRGALLRLSPRWTDAAYLVLLTLVLLALVYGFVGRISDYASGPAFIRLQNAQRLTALTAGTVEEVGVVPGQRVEEGEILVSFHSAEERNVLAQLEAEFEVQLVRYLRNLQDESARAALARLRPQIDLAEARLAARSLTAPSSGIVQDVRIRPGQHLVAGEPVLGLVEAAMHHDVLAFLPGEYRPQLEPGMRLRLELRGYAHAYVDLTVEQVEGEVIGPTEAMRMLPLELRDAVQLQGPVSVVSATLPTTTFEAGGEEHAFFSGMPANAEVVVREKPIIASLIPAVDRFLERLR